ncbi:uncharacterized protein EI97DRAFT_390898 [Westerdykella ornata]|uniref:F-box domain-containing protein n=1 Tax=Westerdykella ornata TaxID=318751 RepID=A0A6A6JVF8_WESOR|nr:uncharacterized protein EI97DRAFT_390898 [Westerdykella ornata]KAF2280093.1 hypothetical protein EI97DRAFT_390898 [Westerdykella ornata]
MAITLPDDVLHLLCEELASQEQFDTLFNCACASRGFAVPALTHLYRSHHLAPVRGGGDDETILISTKQLLTQKWSILWKSIIASALEATLFPYCRYIRVLDLRDLRNLFEDDHFRANVSTEFFSGPMVRFHLTTGDTRRRARLDLAAIIDFVGEVVTQHTPMLETISGQLDSHALVRWAPRLPRLHSLELYDLSPLEDEGVDAAISQNCPHFNSLSIYTKSPSGGDHDRNLARFLESLPQQSLEMFENIGDIEAGAETFAALNAHGESLKDLRLCVSSEALQHLSILSRCTGLESLRIEDSDSRTHLDFTQKKASEISEWLKKCKNLRNLSFVKFPLASIVATPVLLQDDIQLRRLDIDWYILRDSRVFHQALVNKRASLQFLSLNGDTEGMFRDDVDALVDSLKQLTELRSLKLVLMIEILHDEHIISIIENLSHLEDLYVTGMEMNDITLESVAKLRNLRSVAFSGISRFTFEGLLNFGTCLGPGNRGIRVMIDMADPDTLLSDEEITIIRNNLASQVGGSLEYTPFRDPNVSEFETDSD